MSDTILDILKRAPVVPVLVIENADDAVPLARALVKGGLVALEVTLRTPAALDSVRRISAEVPEALVGVGTITKPAEFDTARKAGARFAVSPGATDSLLKAAADTDLPFLPGVATASEIMHGLEMGFSVFKAFPAAAIGGPGGGRGLRRPVPRGPLLSHRRHPVEHRRRLPAAAKRGGHWRLVAGSQGEGERR